MKILNKAKNAIKRGFTLVELVIVIAVIAVLAAVLIPVFGNVIKDAKISKLKADLRNCSHTLILFAENYQIDYYTPQNIKDFLKSEGIDVDKPVLDGYSIWYNQRNFNLTLVENKKLSEYIQNNSATASRGATVAYADAVGASDALNNLPRRLEAISTNEDLLILASDAANKSVIDTINDLYRFGDDGSNWSNTVNQLNNTLETLGNINMVQTAGGYADYRKSFMDTNGKFAVAWLNAAGNWVVCADGEVKEMGEGKTYTIYKTIVSPYIGSEQSGSGSFEIKGDIYVAGNDGSSATLNATGLLDIKCTTEIASADWDITIGSDFENKLTVSGGTILFTGTNVTVDSSIGSVSSATSSRYASISTDDEKQAAEIEQWKSRKAEFKSNYWQWFLGIAPKLNSIEKSQQICNKSVKEWVEYYNVNYLNASDSDLFGEEITESFLRKLYEGGEKMYCPKLLFISLNKDDYLLKNSYYDFYIQRLIRDIRMGVDSDRVSRSLLLLHSMLWTESKSKIDNNANLTGYSFPSVTGKKTSVSAINRFKKDIQTGFIYYNGRTHSLHVRHQKGAEDSGGMLLCRLGIPDDYDVRIIGKDSLIGDDKSADGLTTFQEMMRELEKYKDKNIPQETQPKNNAEKLEVDFIMVDGLSRLNEDELAQCPLNALSDRLRSKSQVAIITADKKLSPSEISTDIVLDMEILPSERPDHQYTALKVSKCLYQKNAYGWHRYKMRNAGIEVIPSIHLQMGQRFLMDDIVTDAVLPINEYPYPFWLNENNDIYEDKVISKARGKYENSQKELLELVGHFEGRFLEKREVKV